MSNHFEIITDSIILLCRTYPDLVNGQKAFRERRKFGASCVVAWHPISNCATIKGLRNFDIERAEFMEKLLDIGEDLFQMYDVEVIEWERGSGKCMKKRRIGERQWVDV